MALATLAVMALETVAAVALVTFVDVCVVVVVAVVVFGAVVGISSTKAGPTKNESEMPQRLATVPIAVANVR